MSTRTRRLKWHPTPPPPPSPKIINLPRRNRRKQPKTATAYPPISITNHSQVGQNYRGKLENLFDEEREFSQTVPIVLLNSSLRRERVEEECQASGGSGGLLERKWKFQVEILRAECNFLRMERKFALKKLERNRVQIERILQSAVHNLASGRNKVHEGKNIDVVLEEEIKDLAENLVELQMSSGINDLQLQNCKNFDKKASRLQRRLEKLGGLSDEKCIKEIQETAEASLSNNNFCEIDKDSSFPGCKNQNKSTDVEMLRRKMEGISKGMLDRMEEKYGSILAISNNSSVASSASTSKRINFPDSSSFSTRHPHQQSMSHEENKCSGRCKALVRRIVEQVRVETEQWSQMQEMLGQLREEMEELQASRDFWEDRALGSSNEIQSLQSSVQEWKQKAITFEAMANELQTEVSLIKGELEKLSKEQQNDASTTKDLTSISLGKQHEKEKHLLICRMKENRDAAEIVSEKSSVEQDKEGKTAKGLAPISLGKQIAREKGILICRLKENRQTNDKGTKQEISSEGRRKAETCNNGFVGLTRSPFRDIGNTSPVMRQNCNAIFPLHCPELAKPQAKV